MRILGCIALAAFVLAGVILVGQHTPVQQQNEILFTELQRIHKLSDAQMAKIRSIFAKSGMIGQGNPAVTQHPMTPKEAQARLDRLGIDYSDPKFEKICGGKYMAPLYNPA